jgi:hypothetical protein
VKAAVDLQSEFQTVVENREQVDILKNKGVGRVALGQGHNQLLIINN